MPINFGILASSYYSTASSGVSAPTFVTAASSTYAERTQNTAVTTTQFTVAAGDLLVVCWSGESVAATAGAPTDSLTPTHLTYTSRQSAYVPGDNCAVQVWTAPVDAAHTNMTVSVPQAGGGSLYCGVTVIVFRAHGGPGAVGTAEASVTSGAATMNLTTQAANSAVVFIGADWTAKPNTTHGMIGGGPGTGTDVLVGTDAGGGQGARYGWLIGRYANTGAAGAKTVGFDTPNSGMDPSMIAIEVKGV